MSRTVFLLLWVIGLACALNRAPARAEVPIRLGPPAASLCRPAIDVAERRHAIPRQLLAAIARVESGRRDPQTGTMAPWPWTINAEGQGSFFDTKPQAIAAVRALQARGVRSIDVGCMQVNLMHHPDAFASLEQAFDPMANADYAARFLTRLFADSGTWPKAAASYHSATPEHGNPYLAKVLAIWPEEQRRPGTALANAWAATMPGPAMQAPGAAGSPFGGAIGSRIIGASSARIIAMPGGAGGSAPGFGPPAMNGASAAPGRDLSSYRSRPIIMASGMARPGG